MTLTRTFWTRAGLAVLAVAALGFAARFGYFQLVKAGYVKYNRFDRRDRGTLRVGDPAPDMELVGYDGAPVRLSRLWTDRPLYIVFGSCT